MRPYHPELLAVPVPRYTSYPTAAEFQDGIGGAEMEAALAAIGEEDRLSLYLHIPYCHEICWYCGCNTGAANRAHRLTAYLDALEAELDLVADRLGGRGRVQRIAFGGGSPNAIEPEAFLRLVDRLGSAFAAEGAELSVELDPRSLTPAWMQAMAAAGVTRASLGVQTLAPHVQEAIGRIQPASMVAAAVEGLVAAGVTSLNFDLMYGLPHQSLADLEDTLRQAVAMRPDRVALFGYAHVPHLIPRQRRIDGSALPDAAMRFEQAELGHRFLVDAGYRPVGFDHFARPDDPLAIAHRDRTLRRNFQGFTDDPAEILLGFGASAISSFPDRILQNEKNAGRYRMLVTAGRLTPVRGVLRSAADRVRARIVESILCHGEADLAPLGTDLPPGLARFLEAGLVERDGDRLRLTADAVPYARVIAATFDTYRQPQAERFSSAI